MYVTLLCSDDGTYCPVQVQLPAWLWLSYITHLNTHWERLMGCSVPKPEGSMQTPAEAMHAVAQRCLVAPTLHIAPPVLPQTYYLSRISRIIFVGKKLSCGEISAIHVWQLWRNLWSFIAIYAIFLLNLLFIVCFFAKFFCHNLRAFMWRKLSPKSTFVEKKWQIWGLPWTTAFDEVLDTRLGSVEASTLASDEVLDTRLEFYGVLSDTLWYRIATSLVQVCN